VPRMSLALVLVLGTCLAFAAPAGAVKPEAAPAPFPEATGQYCEDFAVRIRATTNRGTIRVFSTGAAMITGTLKVEVTNLETGKTIELNISGPARISSDGTTLVGTGAWLLFGEPGFFGPGSPRTLETSHGRLVVDLVDGSIVSQIGHRVELCPALAG
jgi:hypothetical protein